MVSLFLLSSHLAEVYACSAFKTVNMRSWPMNLKQKIYDIIRDDDENNAYSSTFDGIIIFLIILNVVLVILDTFTLPLPLQQVSGRIEMLTVIIFSLEYLLRLWTATCKYPNRPAHIALLKYIFSFMALIDLLAVLPFYLPFVIPIDLRVLRTLRIVRLLRLFKIHRYTDDLATIGNVFKRKASQLISSMLVVSLLMIIASVLMYDIENPFQPERFNNAFSGLWWAVVTLTTVGYGDIYPITVAGKLLSTIISLLGIGLVAVPTGIISVGFMEDLQQSEQGEKPQKCFCPFCGKRID